MTSTTNSFDNKRHRLNTDAPNTLRTPISLVRCSATKEAKAKKPETGNENCKQAKETCQLADTFFSSEFHSVILVSEFVIKWCGWNQFS